MIPSNLQALSDEELLQLESQNTQQEVQQSQPQADLSSLTDNQLIALEGRVSNSQGLSFRSPDTVGQVINSRSPLSILDRAKLSFADDAGRQEYLKGKFKFVQKLPNGKYAVGDSPNNIQPIDPEGMFNDILGDIADVVAEVPVIAGQIAGATSGALGTGGAGVIAGGALGSAAGETAKVGVGKLLGVRKGDPIEQATDIAIAGAFGGIGDGLGQALKFTGKGLSKLAKNSFDRAVAQSENPSKALSMLGKVFKLTAAVNEDDVVEAGLYDFNNALSNKYMDSNYGRELMTKFAKGLLVHDSALGRMVGQGDNWAISKFGNAKVAIKELSHKLANTLEDPRIGIVDSVGAINKNAVVEPTDRKALQGIFDMLFSKNPQTGGYYAKNMTVKEIIDFKKKTRPLFNRYFKSQGVNIDAKRAFAEYLDGITKAVGDETSKLSRLPVSQNPYVKANARFSDWKNDLELLKSNGLDVEDIGDLRGMFRNGQLVSQRIENFFERFRVKNSSAQQAFSQVSAKLPVKFAGQGIGGTVGTLTDELRKFNAAQGFKNANPNFIRMASLTGMVGLNLGRNDPQSAAMTGGIGLLFGTPAGARLLLKGGESIYKNAVQNTVKNIVKTGNKVPAATQRALISRLLSLASGQQ